MQAPSWLGQTEVLGERGYDTRAVVSAFVLLSKFGVNQGFAVYASIMSLQNLIFDNSFVRNHGSSSVFDPSKLQAIDQFGESNWNQSGSPSRF